MRKKQSPPADKAPALPGITSILKPYKGMVTLLIFLALLSNGLNLVLPWLISRGIDAYTNDHLNMSGLVTEFVVAAACIFILSYLQSVIQTYTSEKVAREQRTKLADKISRQQYAAIQAANPSRLLTNLTSDIDTVKLFVSQGIVSVSSSLFIIIGASTLLLVMNWKLGLCVITIIPVIGLAFYMVLNKVRAIFKKEPGSDRPPE